MEKFKCHAVLTEKIAWKLIKKANKDGIVIYEGSMDNLQGLIQVGLFSVNSLYRGKGYSLYVLPEAPSLI